MYLLNEKRQVKGLVVFLLVFALLVTGCVGPLVTTAMAGGPSVAEQLGISNEDESEVLEIMADVSEKEFDLIGEDIDLRSKYIKQFVREDKAIQAVIYEQAVHYEEDGVFKDIDNTLVLNRDEKGAEVYQNRDNGYYNVSLNPNENTKGDTILMEREGSSLSWKLVSVNTEEKQALTRESGEKTVEILSNRTAERKAVASRNEQMTMLENLTSGARYSNVYKGVSLEYFMMPEKVKENIVLDSYINNAEFVFNLSMTNLDAKQREDGMIALLNTKTGEEVFYIEAPYMEDAEMEYSADVKMALVQDGDKAQLIITPSDEWLKKAAYPVKIDPTVFIEISRGNILDTYVSEGHPNSNYYLGSMLKVGEGSSSQTNYAFIKFDTLPTIDASHMVVDAELICKLWKNTNENDVQINAHKIDDNWTSSTIKWSNMPSYNSTIENYEIVSTEGDWYDWEITDIARDWYQTGNNYGLMLRMTPNDNDYVEFSAVDGVDGYPYATITYVSNAGLESYWTYHSQSAGRAGTGYVNDYNGNLIWVHNDLSMNGNRMPVSLSHVYNSCYVGNDEYFLGDGWRFNLSQEVRYETIGSTITTEHYIYIDGDGTKHYFYDDDGTWKIESGLDLTLSVNSSDITITDKSDNVLTFDIVDINVPGDVGELKSITDRNGNVQTLNYTSEKLTSVVDGAGRTTYLTYGGPDGRLSEIKDPADRITKFEYWPSGRLAYVYYPDHTTTNPRKTTFRHTSGYLIEARNFDDYSIKYEYSNTEPTRVIQIDEEAGDSEGGQLKLEYGGNTTTYTDYSGREEYLHFDDYGRTLGAVNDQGQGAYLGYHSGTEDINHNKLTSSSKMQSTVINLIKNISAEEDSGWTFLDGTGGSDGYSCYSTVVDAHFGDRTIKLLKTNTSGEEQAAQTLTLEKGQTYTYSAYGHISDDGLPAKLYVSYYDSSGTQQTVYSECVKQEDIWERLSIAFTLPSGATTGNVTIGMVFYDEIGQVFFDDFQLEVGSVANRCNLIENSDLDGTDGDFPDEYTGWQTTSSDELVSGSDYEHPGSMNDTVIKIVGDPSANKSFAYLYYIDGEAGDTYTFSGWAKANAVPEGSIQLRVKFSNTDGTYSWSKVDFNEDTSEWQMVSSQAVAEKNYDRIAVYFNYCYQENTAYFGGMGLFKEEFGQSYTYDSDGNLISATDLKDQQSSFEYDNDDNLTSFTTPKGNLFEYTYDGNNNVTSSRSAENRDLLFTYDSYGNMIESEINMSPSGTGDFIKATATYANGNYVDIVKDSRGKKTDYDYRSTTGVLAEVTSPNGYDTRYNYNSDNDFLEGVYLDADEDNNLDAGEVVNSYSYNDDRLSSVTANGFSYNFTYDGFGNNTDVKVGTQNLITNTFDVHKGLLTSSTFGNGDTLAYTYDNLDRVTETNYDGGGTEFEYAYTADGMLGYTADNEIGVETHFLYDMAGRLGSINRDNGINSWYRYDDDLSTTDTTEYFYESIDSDVFWNKYVSDKDGVPTYTYIRKNSGTMYASEIDVNNIGQVDYRKYYTGGVQEYKEEYTYLAGGYGTGSTTNVIASVEYNDTDTVSYTYDDNGNITSIKENGVTTIQYYYDALNQLIRENNSHLGTSGKTILYMYDNGGNIDEIKEYDVVTTDTKTPTGTETIIGYTYDTTWDDKLASYDGKAITYDSIGNPLTYDGWEYTWKWGRRLATAGNTSQGISTSYKYNDSGIRTQKTVTDNGNTTTYNYNLMGSQITYEERTGANACEMYYAYDNTGKLYGFYYYGSGPDSFYFYKRNIQGDIIGILDNSGTEVVTYTYDTWGKPEDISGTYASTIGQNNPFRYRGYYYDDETGLYYLNQRYYNPEWGRFINADNFMGVTGVLLSHNLFGYCYNNPVNMIDSSGQTATVMEWVQQTPWLAAIWGAAIAEPTFIGEIAAVVVTVAAYVIIETTTTATTQASTTATAQTTTIASTQTATVASTHTFFRKSIGLPSYKKLSIDMGHIMRRHGPNKPDPNGNKTIFHGMTAEMVRRAIREAYNVCKRLQTQIGPGGKTVLVRGFSETYDVVIEMWVNITTKTIETAYPTGWGTQ